VKLKGTLKAELLGGMFLAYDVDVDILDIMIVLPKQLIGQQHRMKD
jgi:hypothetical protein